MGVHPFAIRQIFALIGVKPHRAETMVDAFPVDVVPEDYDSQDHDSFHCTASYSNSAGSSYASISANGTDQNHHNDHHHHRHRRESSSKGDVDGGAESGEERENRSRERAALLCRLIAATLSAHSLFYPMRDIELAVEIQARRRPIVILLGGTSGCGKSTLAALLAARIGITTIISTDVIRHALRSIPNAPQHLFASTYESNVQDYEDQCRMVLQALVPLIQSHVKRRTPIIVEGVHLLPNVLQEMIPAEMEADFVVPFVVHISNAEKHRERFATRAKYMTLEPRMNRYVAHIDAIRRIQTELCLRSKNCTRPWGLVDNTNVDRSVAVVHASVFGRELTTQMSGKRMLQVIHEKDASGAAVPDDVRTHLHQHPHFETEEPEG
eukprot:ANDGO_00708.mRNA.1 P-loop NTPase domain-containing protein LPA1 homolog 2